MPDHAWIAPCCPVLRPVRLCCLLSRAAACSASWWLVAACTFSCAAACWFLFHDLLSFMSIHLSWYPRIWVAVHPAFTLAPAMICFLTYSRTGMPSHLPAKHLFQNHDSWESVPSFFVDWSEIIFSAASSALNMSIKVSMGKRRGFRPSGWFQIFLKLLAKVCLAIFSVVPVLVSRRVI